MDLLEKIKCDHARFRDPIYGYIEVTKSEEKIIDLPIFQRLRRISQLALTKYVYPGAEHSRFVHSLGVLQSATNIFLSLYRKNPEQFPENIDDCVRMFKILRFAALLHDIGHLPFSHATEEALLEGFKHEYLSKYIIENNKDIVAILDSEGVSPTEVGLLIHGTCLKEHNILKVILSDEFDADRADYLLRDSYYCGVKYGVYDYDRYINSFYFLEGGKIGIYEGGINTIESLLIARYMYNQQVVFHRTRIGFNHVVYHFIRSLIEQGDSCVFMINEGNVGKLMETYHLFDDITLFQKAKETLSKIYWSEFMLRYKHLPVIFDKPFEKNNELSIKTYLSELKNLSKEDKVDYFKKKTTFSLHKLGGRISDEGEGADSTDIIKVVDKKGRYKGNLSEYSAVFKNFQNNPINIMRVHTKPENYEEMKEIHNNIMKKIEGVSGVEL